MKVFCAICDGTNATTELCAACKADPANVDWVVTRDDEEEYSDVVRPHGRLAENIDKKLRPPRPELEGKVLELFMVGGIEHYTARDRLGRAHGKRRRRPLTQREIAARAGCSLATVSRVLRRLAE